MIKDDYFFKEEMQMEEKVDQFLKQKGFTFAGKRVLVGVSGGPDSLALLNYLLNKHQDITLVVGHLDHMFRGEESLQDAKYVEQFCQVRGIPFKMKRVDVPEYMEKTGKSPEVAARECRYQFFAEVMKEYHLSHLALAHHGDDQIETILMRLTRGSSGSARAGIPFMRPFEKGTIVRPFLALSRQEIEQYCMEHHLHPRHDPSNDSDSYLRNRFRKYVLPFLKKENNNVHEHFRRFSEDLLLDEECLQELTKQKMNTVWREKHTDKVTIDLDAFQKLPLPLQRRGIQLILDYLYEHRPQALSAIHIDSFFSLIASENPSGRLDFPSGLKVIRSYRLCHFLFLVDNHPNFHYVLTEPGECILPNGDQITIQCIKTPVETNSNNILLNKSDVAFPVIIRTKEQGDRMSLKGMGGTKKLKSIFIDHKVPIAEREEWPVVTDGKNRILWLPRLKKCHNADTLNNDKEPYILITYKEKRQS
ncbi:tRNA lysidine(34) synthetase TilS [Niallia sp. XMNu-256]|uniref:tRNA lysidine(34) synthetase TilS n=1 Tax=Niallia sp. XMNu-256 TaxID=3082444 RepID=UPI0030D47A44